MNPNKKVDVDKINVEDLLQVFKDINQDAFILYIKSIWKDLAQRSENAEKGINKITFVHYYSLPGIISDRLFAVFDENKNGFLSLQEFYDGMMTLFTKPFDELSYFIFKMYDADNDGIINKVDIKSLMQYIDLDTNLINHVNSINPNLKFSDRVESQRELQEKLDNIFGKEKSINYKTFKQIIEDRNSDIYLFLLIFIMENRPFKKKTIEMYIGCLKSGNARSPQETTHACNKLIASPTVNSKFSPSQFLSNSPTLRHKKLKEKIGLNVFDKYVGKPNKDAAITLKGDKDDKKLNNMNNNLNIISKEELTSVGPVRKNMAYLKNLEKESNFNANLTNKKKNFDENDPLFSLHEAKKYESHVNIISSEDGESIVKNDNDENQVIKYEGFIYKITDTNKFKKLWFKLYDRDLFYYKNKEDTIHKGMHHLSGVFLKEEKPTNIDDKVYYTFKMLYPQKERDYYVEDKEEYIQWIKQLSNAIGFFDLSTKYEIGPKLGNGKFGLVKLATNRQTGQKLAAKFMSKKEMSNVDLELVRTEIEILKVCQHPQIIRIYDVFENADSFYIFMEFCDGGDLFSRLEKTRFKIPEKKAANYIHQILAALCYLHEYGITHRDMKPENILMSDKSDEATLKLIDFGLSKIIGPNETCTEPYGTLSYVAPEVLMERPYTKQVDMWTIGVMAYLFCVGFLPFDHRDEREIAKMTMCDPTPYPSVYWNKISNEAKMFVDACLQKNPSKRMTIKEALVHPWIKKFDDVNVVEKRRQSKLNKEGDFELFTKK